MNARRLVRTVSVSANEEKETKRFVLEYYVLAGSVDIDGACANTYGIEVLKRSHTEFGTLRVEYRKVFDVFCTEAEAESAALMLARNTVTPISVRDVIEQLIGTCEITYEEYEIAAV
ncbi:MAG: hypothetical protein IJ367_01525 [Clostridia bacterium]|nr:hypothetical protein [Clostridia bacterium]